ncbi:hypothetical protein [Amycolatopsis minnesotensis]|uniref:DUF5709 domain-containing protein n=1 Tax=Amycolatopsis minnesotensis TaxID=337894 RepID=A0ABN2QMW8_9PSEU
MTENPETDPAALSSSEGLDEDSLRVDPLEEGVEPPEHWSAVDRHGMTSREQREGEPIEERLAEERADVQPDPVPERPIAATPADRLDQSIEDAPADDEPVAPDERPARRSADGYHGENADVAGGSIADYIRTAR